MYEDLKGKTAIVTGAGKATGIGYAIAEQLAVSGANLIIADLGGATPDKSSGVETGTSGEMEKIARELGEKYGVKTLPVDLDVTSADSIAKMIETVGKTFSRIDVLVNNAGATFGVPNLFHSYDESLWMKTIDVNLHGVFRVTRAVVPMMVGRPGSIVNIASRAGKVPPVFNGAYAVAKAGVIMLTKVMAKELAPMNIRANSVCPGQIMTDLEKWRFGLEADFTGETIDQRKEEMLKTIPLGRIGEPKEAGALVAFLASEASSYITGQALNIAGGQTMEL